MGRKPGHETSDHRAAGRLEGKVALIIGGDSGIGRSSAVLYARELSDVATVYLAKEQADAEETRSVVEAAGRRCLLLPGEVTDPDGSRNFVEGAVKESGQLDFPVNNAAYLMRQDNSEDITVERFDGAFVTNINVAFSRFRPALPPPEERDAIINGGSIAGMRGTPRPVDHASTKGGGPRLHQVAGAEPRREGHPGQLRGPCPAWSPFISLSEPAHQVGKHGGKMPMGRPAQSEEIYRAFVFFATEADGSDIAAEVPTLSGGEVTTGQPETARPRT